MHWLDKPDNCTGGLKCNYTHEYYLREQLIVVKVVFLPKRTAKPGDDGTNNASRAEYKKEIFFF